MAEANWPLVASLIVAVVFFFAAIVRNVTPNLTAGSAKWDLKSWANNITVFGAFLGAGLSGAAKDPQLGTLSLVFVLVPVTALLIYNTWFPKGQRVPYLIASSADMGAVEGQLLTLGWLALKAAGTTPPAMTGVAMVVFLVLVALSIVFVWIHGSRTLKEGLWL